MNTPKNSSSLFTTGNTTNNTNGWFVGHFIHPTDKLENTGNIEIKWGEHKKGQNKQITCLNQQATTLTLLISGRFCIEFPELNETVKLDKMGDYVIFEPGLGHSWKALEDCIVVTFRWPSIPNDQIPCKYHLDMV